MEESKINDQKNDKNMEIDYSLYEEQPEKLFPLAQENFNKNKFEEGLAILEKSIMLAIKKYGGEEKIEVAKFNNQYADGLIQKLMVTNVDYLNNFLLKYENNGKGNKKSRVYTKSTAVGRALSLEDAAYANVLIFPAIIVLIFLVILVSYMIFVR